MPRLRRILVAIKDPSAKSLPSVTKATQLARALGAGIELFHAIDMPIYVDVIRLQGASARQFEKEVRDDYLRQLERIAAGVRRHGIEVETRVEWAFPIYASILRRASRIHADLIVAESHTQRHFAPRLLHLADWELLRSSAVPLLLVKSPRPYRRPAILATVDPTHSFAKPARLDTAILDIGATVADALHGTLHALHAYSPLPKDMVMVPPEGANLASVAADIQATAAAEAKIEVDRLLRSTSIPPARRHLVGAHPIDAIQNTARELRAAIVIMGAISRSGLKRLIIGNTAERVLDRLDCDVLVVKPKGFTSRLPRVRGGARLATAVTEPA